MVSLTHIFAGQYATALQQKQTESLQYQSSRTHENGSVTTVTASVSSSSSQVSYYQSDGQRESLTYGPSKAAPASPVVQKDTPTQAASNILNFITLQLQRDVQDGASKEELQSRLQAGMEGFIKGYKEASDQLVATGLLADEVKSAIEKTYTDVMAGIDSLAEELEIESPVERPLSVANTTQAAPVPVISEGNNITEALKNPTAELLEQSPERLQALLDASSIRYEEAHSRTFDFTLKTKDGDTVTISASAQANMSVQANTNGRHLIGMDSSTSNGFYFDVDGELDKGEIEAITDLLAQVHDVAETFYSGDLEKAFELALDVGYNTDEIAQFALNLTQQVYQQVEDTYGSIAQMPSGGENASESYVETLANNRMVMISRFVEQLQEAQEFANKLGVGTELLSQMAEFYLSEREEMDSASGGEHRKGILLPYVAQVLDSLSKLENQKGDEG